MSANKSQQPKMVKKDAKKQENDKETQFTDPESGQKRGKLVKQMQVSILSGIQE